MFLRLNLICNLVLDGFSILYFTNLTVIHLQDSGIMMKWRVLTLFYINMYSIIEELYSIFSSMIAKSTSAFSIFSVERNEYNFVICLRVKVFNCNILIKYSVVHPV